MMSAGSEIGGQPRRPAHAVSKEVRDEIVPTDQPQVRDRGTAAGLRRLSRCEQRGGRHSRICHAGRARTTATTMRASWVRLIKQYRLPAKVNPIPFNPGRRALRMPSPERVRAFFRDHL